MNLSSADIFFSKLVLLLLLLLLFLKKIGNTSRASSSLDPDHARRV